MDGVLEIVMALALAAANVSVYPLPGTTTASPETQISFRGTTQLGQVVVTGSRTGRHPGRIREHSDGQGASFLPSRRFAAGETVRVRSAAQSYSFKVGRRPTPAPTRNVSPDTARRRCASSRARTCGRRRSRSRARARGARRATSSSARRAAARWGR